ncbi:MAG: hypothetical protein GYA87_09860 [Christensenellaceae bacterium]|nr:hypothetical protein [Christensenellaceae bacterium]
MLYKYAANFYLDSDNSYYCKFPDLEGCFSSGETISEAIVNASEALQGYLETCLSENIDFPKARDISVVKDEKADFTNYITADINLT